MENRIRTEPLYPIPSDPGLDELNIAWDDMQIGSPDMFQQNGCLVDCDIVRVGGPEVLFSDLQRPKPNYRLPGFPQHWTLQAIARGMIWSLRPCDGSRQLDSRYISGDETFKHWCVDSHRVSVKIRKL